MIFIFFFIEAGRCHTKVLCFLEAHSRGCLQILCNTRTSPVDLMFGTDQTSELELISASSLSSSSLVLVLQTLQIRPPPPPPPPPPPHPPHPAHD
jgi:hypothetical protein